ncbi:MAG: helix-hairpin-helix domain-containing protein [Solirubrobacteraceae bacterium]
MAHLPRSQLVAYAVIAVAVLVLGGRWMARGQADPAVPLGGPVVEAKALEPGAGGKGEAAASGGGAPTVEEPSRTAVVHVAGAVRRPGVYRLDVAARVRDAVRRAGGPTGRADVNAINLAALVQDGVQVVVPRRAAAGAPVAAVGPDGVAAEAPAAPVNLNSATAEELQTLDGVGPATAADILEYRTQQGGFRSVDDLDQVPGIGPKTMEALRDRVTV